MYAEQSSDLSEYEYNRKVVVVKEIPLSPLGALPKSEIVDHSSNPHSFSTSPLGPIFIYHDSLLLYTSSPFTIRWEIPHSPIITARIMSGDKIHTHLHNSLTAGG
jgi:hypothetical protein